MLDAFLPENIIQIFIYILIAEVFLVAFLFANIFIINLWRKYNEKRKLIERHNLSKAIFDYMKGKIPLTEVQKRSGNSSKILLLLELEAFNQRFSGTEWENVKNAIVEKYLLKSARFHKNSKIWRRRVYSARVFTLTPLMSDKEAILTLCDDPVFLVRCNVIRAIIQLDLKEGMLKILNHMSGEWGFAHYYYRDALLSVSSVKDLQWIEEVAATAESESLHLACLDILSGKMMTITEPFLLKDVESLNKKLRLAALKVYSRNPQKNSLEVLLKHVNDSAEQIRIEALRGLEHFRSHQTLEILENALKDPSWKVRTQAATSLKNMGHLGREILEKQRPDLDKNAYEVAHYILQLDW